MKAFETSFENVLYRFGLMMAVIFIGLVAGIPLLAFLGLPIFLSAILGLKLRRVPARKKEQEIKHLLPTRSAA